MTGDLRASRGRRRQERRRSWTSSIRSRVLAIVLIPSAALLITGGVVAGNLISQAVTARDFAGYLVQSNGPIVQVTSALEQERAISLRALGGDQQALAGLRPQWHTTNAALSQIAKVASEAKGLNPQAVASTDAVFRKLSDQLLEVRQGVQTGRASATQVDAFYTQFVATGSSTFLQSALSAPDTASAVDEITALDLFSVPDLHSRAVGLGAGWMARGAVPQPDRLELAQLVGAYRNQLQALIPRLPQSGQATYGHFVAGGAWKLAVSGEDDLAKRGKLTVPLDPWLAAEKTVSANLLGLWDDDLQYSQAAAVDAANSSLSRSVLVGSLVLVLAVAAFVAAVVLANGLVRRLRRLRSKTLELADSTLPSMVRRIGDGEPVDVGAEMALSGYGADEIGQVAEAFNTAQRTAVSAAAAEARTRAGVSKVFLDIAHRSQLVVHRQLELLDVAEARQSDPEHLELLFQLDHLATRARRNAENLLILGGGQPGRKWRRAAGLEDVVRSAVSETEHFARVSTVRLPGVRVQGSVVGDLIHLLAELVDNATAFSPPDAAVTVRGNLVGKGVVVEVEDQGLGIEFAERERLNRTLADPPDFQVMAMSGQRHLGLFVVGQLAARHGIGVSLLESAYGGIKAIVLVPSALVESEGNPGLDSPAAAGQPAKPVPPSRVLRDGQAPLAPSPSPDMHPGPRGSAPVPARRDRAPLPRRERLANLAPGLRQDAETANSTRPARLRSPEESRGAMSAFQRGTRLGRHAPDQDNR